MTRLNRPLRNQQMTINKSKAVLIVASPVNLFPKSVNYFFKNGRWTEAWKICQFSMTTVCTLCHS